MINFSTFLIYKKSNVFDKCWIELSLKMQNKIAKCKINLAKSLTETLNPELLTIIVFYCVKYDTIKAVTHTYMMFKKNVE